MAGERIKQTSAPIEVIGHDPSILVEQAVDEITAESFGSAAGEAASPSSVERLAQLFMGLSVGLGMGSVPYGGLVDDIATDVGLLGRGTREARLGKAIGKTVAGLNLILGGLGGEAGGAVVSGTGVGSLVGVPVMVASAAVVTGGAANVAAGLAEFSQAMQMSGGNDSDKPAASSGSAPTRAGYNGVQGPAQVVRRTTRDHGPVARVEFSDKTVLDVSSRRVKEFTPVTNQNAPPGTLQRVPFGNAQPGTKGFKRDPTPEDLGWIK